MATKAKSKPNHSPTKGAGNPLVWAEIPVTDMERAKAFYGNVFGFTFQMQDMHEYKMAMFPSAGLKSYGAGGALMLGPTYTPSYDGPLVYFHTADIEGTLKKAAQNGGTVIQTRKSIGPYGFVAYFEDTEGNRIALHSMK